MSFEEFCKQDQNIEIIYKKINKGNQMYPIYVWSYRIITILCFVIGVYLGATGLEKGISIRFLAGLMLIMIGMLLCIFMLLPGISNTWPPYSVGRELAMEKANLKEYEFDYFNKYLKSHEFVETCDLLNIPYQNTDTVYFLFEGEEHKIDISFLAREERKKILEHKKIDLICKFQWRFWSYSDIQVSAAWPIQFEKVFDSACPNYKRI